MRNLLKKKYLYKIENQFTAQNVQSKILHSTKSYEVLNPEIINIHFLG